MIRLALTHNIKAIRLTGAITKRNKQHIKRIRIMAATMAAITMPTW